MSSKFYFFLGDEVLNLLWTLLCSAVSIRSRQYQYKMQHVCKWAIIDMNNLSRLLCCRVEEDQLLNVEGDFFPLLGAPKYRWMLYLNRVFSIVMWLFTIFFLSDIVHIAHCCDKRRGKNVFQWCETIQMKCKLTWSFFLPFFSKTFKKDLRYVHNIPGK